MPYLDPALNRTSVLLNVQQPCCQLCHNGYDIPQLRMSALPSKKGQIKDNSLQKEAQFCYDKMKFVLLFLIENAHAKNGLKTKNYINY